MSSKPSLESRQKIYRSLCYVLSERAEQVGWDEFTRADWDLFAQMAEREGVAPLMYWKLKESPVEVPPSTFNFLRSTYYQTLAQNTLMYQELERILTALDEAGIEVIVLKGAALAATVYEDIGLRPMGDLDLLAKRDKVNNAIKLMKQLGYFEESSLHPAGFDQVFSHEIKLSTSSSHKFTVELHRDLIAGEGDWRSPSLDWFWAPDNLINVSCADPKTRMKSLTPTAHLLYLSAHLSLQHGHSDARLLWFYDVHLLSSKELYVADFGQLASRARQYQWDAGLLYVLQEVERNFGTLFPNELTSDLEKGLNDQVVHLMNIQKRPSGLKVIRNLQRFSNLSWSGRLRLILILLFPSRSKICEDYNVKSSWHFLLIYPYRWFNLVLALILNSQKLIQYHLLFHTKKSKNGSIKRVP